MIITGRHRSGALALRHLRDLRQRYGYAEIVDRRNSSGRFSSRGHYFTFEVRNEEGKTEYVLHFDYGDSKTKNLIRFQVHVIAPPGIEDREVIKAVRARSRGEAWPQGWKKKAIYWSHPPKHEPRTEKLPRSLRIAAFESGEVSVSGRDSISQHRRTRKKSK